MTWRTRRAESCFVSTTRLCSIAPVRCAIVCMMVSNRVLFRVASAVEPSSSSVTEARCEHRVTSCRGRGCICNRMSLLALKAVAAGERWFISSYMDTWSGPCGMAGFVQNGAAGVVVDAFAVTPQSQASHSGGVMGGGVTSRGRCDGRVTGGLSGMGPGSDAAFRGWVAALIGRCDGDGSPGR